MENQVRVMDCMTSPARPYFSNVAPLFHDPISDARPLFQVTPREAAVKVIDIIYSVCLLFVFI